MLQWWDWFVKVECPVTHWKAQPTYILSAVVFLLGAAGNLVHGELKHNMFVVKSCLFSNDNENKIHQLNCMYTALE